MEVPCETPFTEEQAQQYFRDIVLGIEYCEFKADIFISRMSTLSHN